MLKSSTRIVLQNMNMKMKEKNVTPVETAKVDVPKTAEEQDEEPTASLPEPCLQKK
jgi:hypothetical protein